MSEPDAETVSLHMRVLRAWVFNIYRERARKGLDIATTTQRLQDAVMLMRKDADAGVEALRMLEAEASPS